MNDDDDAPLPASRRPIMGRHGGSSRRVTSLRTIHWRRSSYMSCGRR